MLEIKNLSKRFGDQQVLDHINLKIEKGKVFVIIVLLVLVSQLY